MQTNKGAALPIIIILVVLAGGAAAFTVMRDSEPAMEEIHDDAMMEKEETGEAMEEKMEESHSDDSMMMEDKEDAGEAMEEKSDGAMMEEKEESGEAMMEESVMEETTQVAPTGGFTGKKLAGSDEVPLLVFNQEDYDRAIAEGRVVVLFFYAEWCPTCRIDIKKMEDAFDELTDQNAIGFRVNYKDTNTEQAEKDLAREFGVGYQHTKVIVKDGERILKAPEGWDKDDYITNINANI